MGKEFDLHDYSDILDMPHHTSTTRPRMSRIDRGAQFSPFAALTGYGAAVNEAGRLTDEQHLLTEDEKAYIDHKIQLLKEHIGQCPVVNVQYFLPDRRKHGGAYVVYEGHLREIDEIACRLIMEDHTVIPIDRIKSIESGAIRSWDSME